MPRFKIVINDPEIAHQKEIERNVNARLREVKVSNAVEMARTTNALHREASKQFKKRQAGDVHDVADSDCPEGLPNCRNCGDPHHVATCRAAGHCHDCGTKHGVAPDRILAANGYRLEVVTPEEEAAELAARERVLREPTDADIEAQIAGLQATLAARRADRSR
jgi:hypothetical protein